MASRGLWVVLSSALAFGLGLALGLSTRWGAPAREALVDSLPTASADTSKEMALLLTEMRRALETLTAQMQRLPNDSTAIPVEASQRRPIEYAEQALNSTDLAAALKSLSDVLRDYRPGGGAAAPARPEDLVKPVFVDREAAFAATGLRRASAAGEESLDRAKRDFNQNHMFLTNQAVLSRYGTPDEIEHDGGMEIWIYELPREEGSEHFSFKFNQGTVFEAEYSG